MIDVAQSLKKAPFKGHAFPILVKYQNVISAVQNQYFTRFSALLYTTFKVLTSTVNIESHFILEAFRVQVL